MARRYVPYAISFLAVMLMTMCGCAGKKGAVKESLSVNATDQEKREFALRLFKEGAELLFSDNQAALTKFENAAEVDPTLIPAYFNAGVALEALGRPLEASQKYDKCLEYDKQQTNCLDNWVLVNASLGEIDKTEQRVLNYLSEFPEAPFAMVAAAKLALYRKDYVRAEKYARQAIEREAENVEALFVMARIFYERKQYSAAKWVLKNALEIAPSHGELHLLLGHTENALGLLHDALDSYALAVKAQPTAEALESYGLLLLKRGRVAEALPLLKRLVELRPDDARNHLHLGNAYMANKMFDEAKASYLLALEKKPDDLDVNFNLGLLFYDLKPKDLAEIDRLKTAKSYFEAFMKKPGLSKDRQAEVKEYLRLITQKIEMEEYAAESAKAAAEEEKKEKEEEEKIEEEKPEDEEGIEPEIKEEPKEEKEAPKEPPRGENEKTDQDSKKATKTVVKEEVITTKEQDSLGLDEDEEGDFFDDL